MARQKAEAPRKTGKWLDPRVPHTGWRCIEINDHGAVCDMCEVTRVSNVHVMCHDRYPLPLWCGCVCAGFMAGDPASEHLRELLYKWRRAQQGPVEKLRRKDWSRNRSVRSGHVFGWSLSTKKRNGFGWVDWFTVEISNIGGWRYHVFRPWHAEIIRSEVFAFDLLAATAGIEHAEMLRADHYWVAADCEALAERHAADNAKWLASKARSALRRADEEGREDIRAAVEAGRLTGDEAMLLMFGRYLPQEERQRLTEKC